MQIYFYHKSFPEDPPWIKLGLVNGIWLIELVHTVCIAHEVYFYTVLHFGDTSTFNGWPVSFAIAATAICHGVVAVLAELVFNVMIGVEIATIARQSFISFRQKWQWLILAVLILRAALDVLISGTLVYYLTYHRNNAYKNTIAVIDKLILWTIETGIVTRCVKKCCFHANHGLNQNAPQVFSNTLLANMQTTVVPMSNDVMTEACCSRWIQRMDQEPRMHPGSITFREDFHPTKSENKRLLRVEY
ncbi:hypothetical protein F5876DRAFT_65745 [Lentinula aff. lateritia]|uniref:Uncharacterized protein n=1 Tax=Lentinula aff. lateritia TaxID=2804960 RepID=A0ACC1TZR0_9AGAR|nr:hypothetical protein F5876DRAFT_65745 [Lentinula aff. lateritia]